VQYRCSTCTVLHGSEEELVKKEVTAAVQVQYRGELMKQEVTAVVQVQYR